MPTNATVPPDARGPGRRPFAPHRLALALAASLLALGAPAARAQTLPSGLSVAAGNAKVSVVGERMTVVNTPQAILNWNSFSIGATHSVYFQQASATSQVLNRVVGNDPSSILGSLGSNGRVWLVNPNGVLFGQGARVDVAGLVASNQRLADTDWLAGRYRFDGNGSSGGVTNQGELRTSLGGTVALVGNDVRNEGLIQTPGGQIILAAGHSVELVDTAAPTLGVRITASSGTARNLGTLQAAGGRIDIHAASVNQQGLVSADALATGAGGEVWIRATESTLLGAASRTSADGARGGQVQVETTAGRTSLDGQVSAQGTTGVGGNVALLGREVGLMAGSRVDASGATGGGSVQAGGGERGQDGRYANAQGLYFDPKAAIAADALDSGNGGRIVLYSERATRAYGSLSARGGAASGDGGFVETSGGWLDARPGRLDTQAPKGRAGAWLLDPFNIRISDEISDTGFGLPSFTATAGDSSLSAGTILNALNAGTSVAIDTARAAGTQAGDITVSNANLVARAAAPGSLTLTADGSIFVSNASLGSATGPMAVTLLAGRSGRGSVTLSGSAVIDTRGNGSAGNRDVRIGGFASGSTPTGGSFNGAGTDNGAGVLLNGGGVRIDAGNGRVDIAGISTGTGSAQGAGVDIVQATVNGRDISITGQSTSSQGVVLSSGAAIEASHTTSVQGVGLDYGVLFAGSGSVWATPASADPSAGVLVQGRSTAARGGSGVLIEFNAVRTPITALNGASVTVEAANVAGDTTPALRLDGTGNEGTGPMIDASLGGALTVRNFGSGSGIDLRFAPLLGGSGPAQVQAAGALVLNAGSSISANGPVTVSAETLSLAQRTGIASQATGTAVLLSGPGNSALSSFTNNAVAALGAPNGRWIVYARDITGRSFAPGTLAYDFTRHGAAFGAWSGDAGNGFVSAAAQTATFTAQAASRAYDGTVTAPLTQANAVGALGQAGTLRSGVTARYADANAGNGKAAAFSSAEPFSFVDAAAKPVYGYTLSGTLSGNVTPAVVSGAPAAAGKVYDGTTAASVSVGSLSGLVGSETLGVVASGSFASKNAGVDRPVNATYQLQDGSNGGLASNYRFVPRTGTTGLTATITPRPLSVSGLSVADKVYDATAAATLTGTPSVAALPGDTVQLGGTLTARFADKNAGTDKAITLTGYTLGGADASNYSLAAPPTLRASITPLNLSVSGLTADGKVYDGSTAATVSGTPQVTALPGDSLLLVGSPSARFLDKNVDRDKQVTLTGFGLGGADAANYRLVTSEDLRADIKPLNVVLDGLVANDKPYDGNTTATLSGNPQVGTLLGDAVALAGAAVANFADKNVGAGKAVTISGFGLLGPDSDNYQLVLPTSLRASITPAVLSYVAEPQVRIIGQPVAGLRGTVTGFIAGESQATATTGTVVFTSPVTVADQPGAFPVVGSGLRATNYVFVQGSGNAVALSVVDPGPVTVGLLPGGRRGDPGSRLDPTVVDWILDEDIDPNIAGMVDVSGGDLRPPARRANGDFGAVRLSSLTADELQALLDGRRQFKQDLLADAVARLEKYPGLADMRECVTLDETDLGLCLVTATLKERLATQGPVSVTGAPASAAGTPVAAAPTPAPAPAAPPAAAPAVASAPAPAPAPAAPALAAAARPAVALPASLSLDALLARRKVRSAALPQIERKIALVVGVDRYDDAAIPSLNNAVRDAEAVARVFESKLGYESVVIANATRQTFVAAMNRLALALGPRDSVVVYFAGHGELVEATKLGYWLLADSVAAKPETWLSNTDISRLIAQMGASQVALVSDSCYSGSLASEERIRAVAAPEANPVSILARKSVVVMSSGGNEPVFDEGKDGHSPFAYSLMNTLGKVATWQPGGNVFERVRFAVARALPQRPQYSASRAAGHQAGGDYLFEQRQLDGRP